eukprot:6804957-Pyramimonas_sp.AAC.1
MTRRHTIYRSYCRSGCKYEDGLSTYHLQITQCGVNVACGQIIFRYESFETSSERYFSRGRTRWKNERAQLVE